MENIQQNLSAEEASETLIIATGWFISVVNNALKYKKLC